MKSIQLRRSYKHPIYETLNGEHKKRNKKTKFIVISL